MHKSGAADFLMQDIFDKYYIYYIILRKAVFLFLNWA